MYQALRQKCQDCICAMSEMKKNGQLDVPEELKQRAREFFAKAADVAYTLNYDYAVELYLDGLNYWPDAVEDGHKKLREIAIQRQSAGGKKSGFGDKSKYKKGLGKTPRDEMLKAEYLLSKDPANLDHVASVIKGALGGGYRQTVLWFSDVLFDANLRADKPSFQKFVFLRDAYIGTESFARALQACQNALQFKPNDEALKQSAGDLTTQATMQKGKYDTDSDFRDSIQDRETQDKLHAQEDLAGIRAVSAKAEAIERTRVEYEAAPTVPGKISSYVAALTATEQHEHEQQAMAVLEKAYESSSQFSYMQRRGEIAIRQLNRNIRVLREQLGKESDNAELKKEYSEALQTAMSAELEHYEKCVENFPTDMGLKYEYGLRLLKAKRYDDAIPMFQESRREPRRRIASLNSIGQCWFYKEWYPDAIETFQEALDALESKEDGLAKELRYNLGRAYEADSNPTEALNSFRKVAQIDFNYRDVKTRVDALRKAMRENKE